MARRKRYLDHLTFPPQLMNSWMAKYLQNTRLMVLFIVAATLAGVFSFATMKRSLNPEVEIPIVLVSTVLPGAAPSDIETLVTKPIENAIKNVEGISTYASTSTENSSTVSIEFLSSVDPDKARQDVSTAVDQAELPEDATTPNVYKIDFEDQPVWMFALKPKNANDIPGLMQVSKHLQEDLEDLPQVDRIVMSGYENQEIQITIDQTKASSYQLNPQELNQAIEASLNSFPAGNVSTQQNTFVVSVKAGVTSLNDLRQLPVRLNGSTFTLDQIAEVSERAIPNQAVNWLAQPGQDAVPTVQFTVYKTKASRVDQATNAIQKATQDLLAEYDNGRFESVTIVDFNKDITDEFDELTENFMQTLLLVFLSMFLVYGLRQAIVASLAIPFPLLITFSVMQAMGLSLNFLSIFSLLIALGLFVDNAVVVIEGFSTFHKTKKFTPLQSALLVFRDFTVPLISINLVTVWAFLPLLISGGIIGEFIKPIPIIVSTSMFASVLIALFFTLPSQLFLADFKLPRRMRLTLSALGILLLIILGVAIVPKTALFVPTVLMYFIWLIVFLWLRKSVWTTVRYSLAQNKKVRKAWQVSQRVMDHGLISLEPLSQRYRNFIEKLIATRASRLRTLAFIGVLVIASYALLPLGVVVNEFFPKSDIPQFNIAVELPSGTRREIAEVELKRLLNEFKDQVGVQSIVASMGSTGDGIFTMSQGSNVLSYLVVLTPKTDRQDESFEIAQTIRDKYENYDKGTFRVEESTGGPPAGADVQIQLQGDDFVTLEQKATEVENYLKSQPGVTNLQRSIKPSLSRIVFVPDLAQLKKYNLSSMMVGGAIRSALSGTNLGTAQFLADEREIVFRTSQHAKSVEELSSIQIPTATGVVPINELGEWQLETNPTVINRDESKRSLSVTASVLAGTSVGQTNQKLTKFAENELNLPNGYAWKTGGVNEENNKSVQSIIQAMGISAILILVTLVVQLKSFRKAFLVMLAIPLAISGVFIWFGLTGTPLSFPALIGLLALFGIVIANSIVLLDKINQNIEAGLPQMDAVIDASATRLEPIALTSVSSIIGLVPITLADPIWRGLGGAIIAGLSFSGILILICIPVLYMYLYPNGKR